MAGNVIIKWRNGFGNCLFQYIFARLFAEHYGMNLCYSDENGRSCYKNPVEYGFIDLYEKVSLEKMKYIDIFNISSVYGRYEPFFNLDGDRISKMSFLVGYPSYIRGLIEDYRIYLDKMETINSWFESPGIKNHDDLAFHIRLGDNWNTTKATNGGVIPQEYYLHAARMTDYNKLYIITDDMNDKYHDAFKHLNPIFLSNDEQHEDEYTKEFRYLNKGNVNYCIRDFNFLRSFDNLVVGNSTFSWWAAFLGQNKNVFIYEPWQRGHVNLGQTKTQNWTNIPSVIGGDFLSLK